MPDTKNTSPTSTPIPVPPPNDPGSFMLYLSVSEVSLVRPTRDRPFPLSYVKCDNFEEGKPLYNGIGSFYFYTSHEEAPKAGEMFEVIVKPWKNTLGEITEAGKKVVASFIETEEANQSNQE